MKTTRVLRFYVESRSSIALYEEAAEKLLSDGYQIVARDYLHEISSSQSPSSNYMGSTIIPLTKTYDNVVCVVHFEKETSDG